MTHTAGGKGRECKRLIGIELSLKVDAQDRMIKFNVKVVYELPSKGQIDHVRRTF